MLNNLKSLIVVIVLATAVFQFIKPIALMFSAERDFLRRRNIWYALTIAAFMSPNFWWFTVVAVPLLFWSGLKDSNIVALYLFLMQVIPPAPVDIPAIGVNHFFALDIYRLLAFSVLIPAAWRTFRKRGTTEGFRPRGMDLLLLAYGVLQAWIFVRPDVPNAAVMHDSVTNIIRRAFLFFVDVYVLYYVVSRCCFGKRQLTEAMSSYCIICVVMAAIAVFESARHWLLYAVVGQGWGTSSVNYIMRAGVVRSAVSSGNPLVLGYLLSIALGFWLYLRRYVKSFSQKIGVTALLLLGLIAAYSRGPWLGSLLILFGFAIFGPRAGRRLFRVALATALVVGLLLISPFGSRITKVIPFMGGQVDVYNITYRERLLDRSLEIVREHPWLGNQNAYAEMQDLRQGVGVIDFVNTYAEVAVFYGLVGLALFLSFILWSLLGAYRLAKMIKSDVGAATLCASIAACILGTLLMIYTSSFIFGFRTMFYVLCGFATACASLALDRRDVMSAHRLQALHGST